MKRKSAIFSAKINRYFVSNKNYRRCYSAEVELTSQRYPNLKRRPYAYLGDNDVKFFESILGSNRVLTQAEDLKGKHIVKNPSTMMDFKKLSFRLQHGLAENSSGTRTNCAQT